MRLLTRDFLVKAMAYGRIVDVGCFDGRMFGDTAVNVDFKKYGDNIPNLVLADAHRLPFKDRVFDCAVMSELLEHVDDPKKVLQEAQRVAKIIILSVPNEYEWSPNLNPFCNPGHKRFFKEQTLLQLVYESGLQLTEFIKVSLAGWSHFVVMGISSSE